MEAGSNHAPLIVIVGETASGKSELALRLAEMFEGEIVAADSWTVYRDFNIGTAKPSAADRARVSHHLLDIADPRNGFSAAEYKRMALETIDEVASRNKVPILAGGTGLYIDSVIFDYSFLPPATPDIRTALSKLTIEELLQRINDADIDPAEVDLRNKRRLIRLIETSGATATRKELRSDTLIIGIPVPREELRERIIKRVDMMLDAGLEDEVAALARKYGWNVEPMKGIGYREFYEYFNGTQTLEQTRTRVISASLGLAKRQRTWFKRNNSIHWIGQQTQAVDLVTTLLNKYLL